MGTNSDYLCVFVSKIKYMQEESIRLDRIEDAIEAIRQGKMIIVADDENRENEGI